MLRTNTLQNKHAANESGQHAAKRSWCTLHPAKTCVCLQQQKIHHKSRYESLTLHHDLTCACQQLLTLSTSGLGGQFIHFHLFLVGDYQLLTSNPLLMLMTAFADQIHEQFVGALVGKMAQVLQK